MTMTRLGCLSSPTIVGVLCVLLACCGVSDVAGDDTCTLDPNSVVLMKFNLNVQEKGREHIKIEADKSTMDRLEKITNKIAIVSIMGQARTGKSFLMNQLLGSTSSTGGKTMFKVGHTVQTETEEVNMFIVPPCAITAPDVPKDTTLLFLDTPGLFATNRGAVFDSQLVAVMNLLSSVVLYNVKDNIPSRELIHQLADAIHAAFVISYFDPNKAQDKSIDRPYLYWVLQNLVLQNINHDGKEQTVKSFIQELLSEVDANHIASEAGAAGVAQEFNGFFKGVDGHILPFPVDKTSDFDKLDQKTDDELTPKFKEARTALRQKIFGVMTPKKLGNDFITGPMLAELIRMWIENVNIPLTAARDNSASVLLKHIEDKEVNKAVEKYKSHMDGLTAKYPLTDQQLTSESQDAMTKALVGVNEKDMPTLVQAVKDEITKLFREYVSKNEHGIRSTLENIVAAVVTAHNQRVMDLKTTLPTNQAAILVVFDTSHNEWSSKVEPVRAASAAAIPDFEPKLKQNLDESKKQIFSENLQLHTKKILDEFKAKNHNLMIRVPVEQVEVDAVKNEAVAAWNAIASDMSQMDANELQTHGAGVMSTIRDYSHKLDEKNSETSVIECTNKARELVGQALEAYSGWSTYQSAESFDQQLYAIQNSDYCRGPGRNSSAVLWNFHRVRADYAQTLRNHILICHAFTLVAWGLAMYAGYSLPYLFTLNHWDHKNEDWHPLLTKIYPFAGAGLIYISRLLPGAVWSIYLNYFAAIILALAFVIGFKLTIKSWRRETEARWD